MMSESALSRHAGPIVLVVGAYLAVAHLALLVVFMSHSDPAAMLADPIFRVLNLAYAAAFSGLAIAACAAYDKQARAAGTFGLVALCAAMVGTVNLGANMWFEGFAAPWLADVVPQVLIAEKTTFWKVGYLSSYTALLHRLGALRACLPAGPRLSASHQPRDRGRRNHRLPGGKTTVRRRAGTRAAEPGDLDGQDPEGRRHTCAADHGLIVMLAAHMTAVLTARRGFRVDGAPPPATNHTPSVAMARPRGIPQGESKAL